MYSMSIKSVKTYALPVLNEYKFFVYVLGSRAPSPMQSSCSLCFINEM